MKKDEFLKQCKGRGIRERHGAEEDCGRIFTAIHDLIDGELPADLCRELDELREKCPFCVDTFLKTMQKTIDVYGHLPDKHLPEDDRTRLRNKILEGLEEIRRDIENC